MNHLSRHWHHYLSVCALIGSGVVLGIGGQRVYEHISHGGYTGGPLPPTIAIGGGVLPASFSLGKDTTRVHNQGNSNSCVGQTLSTMVEIINRERHTHQWRHFSAGYIWNQVDQGRNQGISYQDAFSVLLHSGDARLKDFPWDGATGWGVQPNSRTRSLAYSHRFLSFRSIAPSDTHTIQSEIYAGHPIALAIPVTDSFYQLWNTRSLPTVSAQSGPFHFYHSITGIGYTPRGLIILNSWGTSWGHHGRALLTWPFISANASAIVVASPLPTRRAA
jgi:hypothetical protein